MNFRNVDDGFSIFFFNFEHVALIFRTQQKNISYITSYIIVKILNSTIFFFKIDFWGQSVDQIFFYIFGLEVWNFNQVIISKFTEFKKKIFWTNKMNFIYRSSTFRVNPSNFAQIKYRERTRNVVQEKKINEKKNEWTQQWTCLKNKVR